MRQILKILQVNIQLTFQRMQIIVTPGSFHEDLNSLTKFLYLIKMELKLLVAYRVNDIIAGGLKNTLKRHLSGAVHRALTLLWGQKLAHTIAEGLFWSCFLWGYKVFAEQPLFQHPSFFSFFFLKKNGIQPKTTPLLVGLTATVISQLRNSKMWLSQSLEGGGVGFLH